jgi:hypothetical protein
MPTFREKLAVEVALALDKIKHARLHPEERDQDGRRIYRYAARTRTPQDPLAPRDRLPVRLELLVSVKAWELALMKEIMADTEAIADAKAHSATCAGCEEAIGALDKPEMRFAGTPGISPSEIGERFGRRRDDDDPPSARWTVPTATEVAGEKK